MPGMPPQSSNAISGDADPTRAGAVTGVRGNQDFPTATPSRLGPPHSASITQRSSGPEDSDVDPTVKALKAIFRGPPKRWM
jgi:hypothetical protein